MIRTQELTKFYGSRCAVKDLSITIESREIVGFLGLNGAGKTTTLRMLAGLLAPSSGRIEIEGHDVLATDAHKMRWRIGFLPERPPVYDDMAVRSYLDFAARLRGYDPARAGARVGEVLELTSLEEYADEPVSSLSHGYRQRVGIAQAVVHDPALVILDEPTSGLDPVQIVEMRRLIRNLKDQHTVLLSSHNLPEISQSCDRIMVVKDGVLVWAGSEHALSEKLGRQAGGSARVVIEVVGDEAKAAELFSTLVERKIIQTYSAASSAAHPGDAGSASTPRPAHGTIPAGLGAHGASAPMHPYQVDLGATPPEDLARAVFVAGLGLRRLQPQAHELEGLFLELTKEDGR